MERIGKDGNLYVSQPAVNNNPDGRLDGEWVIRRVQPGQFVNHGKIVKRFKFDGRDRAETWLLALNREVR
jgi:hypothetical protein